MLQSKDSDTAHSACREAPTVSTELSDSALNRSRAVQSAQPGGALGKSVPLRTACLHDSNNRTAAAPVGRWEELCYCWLRRSRCERGPTQDLGSGGRGELPPKEHPERKKVGKNSVLVKV